MEEKSFFDNVSGLKENLQKYFETKASYYSLLAFEKAVKLVISVVSNTVTFVIIMLALVFVSGAAGLYVGRLLQSYELGLLIIGGFYLLLGILLFVFRRKIYSRSVIKHLGEIFFQDDDNFEKK